MLTLQIGGCLTFLVEAQQLKSYRSVFHVDIYVNNFVKSKPKFEPLRKIICFKCVLDLPRRGDSYIHLQLSYDCMDHL